MNIFKLSTWGLSKVFIDIRNYYDFIQTIKKEKLDKNSKFNKWNLKNNYFYNIYFTYDLDESESNLPDNVKKLRLIESLAPLHIYLDEELGFAECLVPEISQFYNDKNEPTLTYLVMYRFAFNKLSLGWVIKWLTVISLTTALVAFFGIDLINFLTTFL